jgi:ATP phosphoribosyltransferase regulatory subunit HisZ
VIRPQPARLRQLPELYQLGFERYGVSDAGVEALTLTCELLRTVGVAGTACHVTLSVAGMAERVLAGALGAPSDEELVELLRVRDLDALADSVDLNGRVRDALAAALFGEPENEWADVLGVRGEVESLAPFVAAAGVQGVSVGIDVAPRLTGAYYHGVVFTVWGRRTRAVLAGGGEYEVPTRSRRLPAVGACLALGIALEEAAC